MNVMEKEQDAQCNQCGDCCRYVAIKILDEKTGKPIMDNTDFFDWVSARALQYTEDGWLVIPSACPRLNYDYWNEEYPDKKKWVCSVHNKKPEYCKRYPIWGDWVPSGCSMQ